MSAKNDPATQFELAKQVLAHFISLDESLTDGRHIIHYFYGEPDTLPGLRTKLEGLGYLVRDTLTSPGLIAETMGVTDEAWAESTMSLMCELADEYDAEYDGWEASTVRQKPPKPTKKGLFRKLFGRTS